MMMMMSMIALLRSTLVTEEIQAFMQIKVWPPCGASGNDDKEGVNGVFDGTNRTMRQGETILEKYCASGNRRRTFFVT